MKYQNNSLGGFKLKQTNKYLYLAGLTGLMGLDAGAAFAQSAPALEEIIVTAQRREENLQSTPISVSSIDSERLREMDANTLEGMSNVVPNFSVGNATGQVGNRAAVSIRGVNEALGSIGTSPAVGIYIDDVYFGQPGISFLRLIDVERVEVLRGPQGTLFGRNSLGGAIRYITAKPEFDGFSGYISSTLGQYDRMDLSAAVNIPLSDSLAIRLKGASLSREGYIDRLASAETLGGENTEFASGQLRWQPSSELDVNLGVDRTVRDTDNGPRKIIDYFNFNGGYAPTGGDGGPPPFTAGAARSRAWNSRWGTTPLAYSEAIPDSLYQVAGRNPVQPRLRSISTGVTLNISYDINDSLNLRSITGQRSVDDLNIDNGGFDSGTTYIFNSKSLSSVDFWSQEIQLTGTGDRLNWTAGLYLSREEVSQLDLESHDQRAGFAYGGIMTNNAGDMTIAHEGVFAQGTYDLTERLSLTLGARYAIDDKDYRTSQQATWDAALAAQAVAFGITPLAPPARYPCDVVGLGTCTSIPELRAQNDEDSFTTRLSLEYQWNDDLMTYAAYSEGFKVGGPNDAPQDINISFPNEEMVSYEIGIRSELMDGRLRANATYFWQDNTDKQITVAPAGAGSAAGGFVSPCFGRCIFSAGDVEIQGIELDVLFAATDSLQLHANVGTLDAEWVSVVPGGPATLNSDPALAPDLSYNLGAVLDVPMTSLQFLVDYSYKGDQESSPQDSTTLTIPNYDLWTLRLKYEDPDGRWDASLFCSNCANEEYIVGGNSWAGSTDNTIFNYKPATHPAYSGPNANPNVVVVPEYSYVLVGPPRMVGVDFRYNF